MKKTTEEKKAYDRERIYNYYKANPEKLRLKNKKWNDINRAEYQRNYRKKKKAERLGVNEI